MFFEVWDDGTGNRVGGSFASENEVRSLLLDILRVNGPDVAREIAILAFHPTEAGRYAPVTVLEGAEFVEQTENASSSPPASRGRTV
jgi:hypothetical protein